MNKATTEPISVVRPPAVAGAFYPADPDQLRAMATACLHEAGSVGTPPKAMIVPHAGYEYSGPIAATAYARLTAARDRISKVILLGPSHRLPFYGLAVSSADYFATPLGNVPIDREGFASALHLPQVKVLDEAHQLEHSLEVHLPFLQLTLNQFSLLPLVVGDASATEVSDVLDTLWGGDETLIVVSSDLSHYLNYSAAKMIDKETAELIEELRADEIGPDRACGCRSICGLLDAARQHGLHATAIDLRNSGDTAGSHQEVVGYGAFVFSEDR